MRIFNRIAIFLGLMLGSSLLLNAQSDNSLYFMRGVPQANRINPARQPECGFYFGIPGIAPLSMELSSSSLAYDDLIYPHPTEDSLITFLHPLGDQQAFLKQLKPLNYVLSDVGTSLFSMGFRTGIGFFSLDVTTRVDGNFFYPGDLAKLVLEGADDGEVYTMDGTGVDLSVFDEISLGWSGAIGNNWQIGIRGKALFGLGNLSASSSDLAVSTSEELWNIRSNMVFKASLPFAEVIYDEEGMIEDIILDEDLENLDPGTIARTALNRKNFGLGFDLGIDFRPSDRWLLSASILDLGYIRWTDEVHELSYMIDYDFTSQEINPLHLDDNFTFDDWLDSTFSQIGDSLAGALEFTPGGIYSRRLNTKLFIGAAWFLTPNINLGLLSRTDVLREAVAEQITASANMQAGRFLSFTLSYSYINDYYKNFGAGISLNAGPLNIYVISDNILNAVFWPQEVRSAKLWFGMNFVFGYRKFTKADRDRPLVY
ncbi:MAG: DUF5723 family protein [Bacteroidales bacterium]|nr:DUF5723 family protein [Bacteroidales bacterium]